MMADGKDGRAEGTVNFGKLKGAKWGACGENIVLVVANFSCKDRTFAWISQQSINIPSKISKRMMWSMQMLGRKGTCLAIVDDLRTPAARQNGCREKNL